MLFTWNTNNLCLVFRWWHISTTFSLILSLLGVVALSAGYEYLRTVTRRYETWADSLPASKSPSVSPEWKNRLPNLRRCCGAGGGGGVSGGNKLITPEYCR